ncbi:MAG TPA: hypothetical protein VI168_03905, partial [Croceibacterium sp.]
ATPENLELQRAGRVLGFPFHFLDNNQVMNVVPKNYGWNEFYGRLLDLTEHSFTPRAIMRRWSATRDLAGRTVNFLRAISSEGFGRAKHFRAVRHAIATDPAMRRYLEQDGTELPPLYLDKMRSDLGPFWQHLPAEAVHHDPYAYMHKQDQAAFPAASRRRGSTEPATNSTQIEAQSANR